MSPARRTDLLMVVTGVTIVVLDQLTKWWVATHLTPYENPIPIVGQILELLYVQNRGAAFSILEGQTALFIFILAAIGVIGWLYWRLRDTESLLLKLTFGLIIGGAVGNLIDRFRHGYVVDFIHFQLPAIHFNFAVFNVADSGISVGVVLLALALWRGMGQNGAGSPAAAPRADHEASATGGSPQSDSATEAHSSVAIGQIEVAPRIRRKVTVDR